MRRRAYILALCTALGCGTPGSPANPFAPETRVVTSLAARWGYLDATLAGPSGELRFFFPQSPACAAVLRPEAEVRYVARGRYGQLANPDPEGDPCVPLGVGSLRTWRDRAPRPQVGGASASPLVRRTARFQEVYRDEREIFLRGRWELAAWIGMAPADDLVAIVPNTEQCRSASADGEATLEYRVGGPEAYALMVEPPGQCPVVGFAIPPDPRR